MLTFDINTKEPKLIAFLAKLNVHDVLAAKAFVLATETFKFEDETFLFCFTVTCFNG